MSYLTFTDEASMLKRNNAFATSHGYGEKGKAGRYWFRQGFVAELNLWCLQCTDIEYLTKEEIARLVPVPDPNVKLRKPVVNRTAFLVPFFRFHDDPVMLDNYNTFLACLPKNAEVFVCELAYDDDEFVISPDDIVALYQLRGDRTKHLMWQKERMLNYMLKSLPSEYTNVVWIDADVVFYKPETLIERIEKALGRHSAVQLFDTVDWLDGEGKKERTWQSIVKTEKHTKISHPGFAWAARREEIEKIGFYDRHIAGNGDQMILSILGGECAAWCKDFVTNKTVRQDIERQHRVAEGALKSNLGYLRGQKIDHLYHGAFDDRKYKARHYILTDNNFDPSFDIVLDEETNLLMWNTKSSNHVKIKQGIDSYWKQRKIADAK